MPRPNHISPQTRAVLEQLAASHPGWAHGYDLSKATDLRSGTLYPILRRLHESGLLDAEWEPSPHAGKPPRHIYRLSAAGLKLARERREETPPLLRGALL